MNKINISNGIYYNRNMSENGHILITGKSGFGKSTAIRHILHQVAAKKENIFVFDFSDSFPYENTIDIRQSNPILFPFASYAARGSLAEGVSTLSNAFASVWNLSAKQKLYLTNSLKKTFLQIRSGDIFPNPMMYLQNCLESYDDSSAETVLLKLSNYCLFADEVGQSESDSLSSTLQVFRYPNCGMDINNIFTELYLWDLWFKQKYSASPEPVYVVADECQLMNFRKNSIMLQLLTQGRKYNIHVILATQFLTENFNKQTIAALQQASLKLTFAPSDTELRATAHYLSQENWKQWYTILKALHRGECIVSGILSTGTRYTYQQLKAKIPAPAEV